MRVLEEVKGQARALTECPQRWHSVGSLRHWMPFVISRGVLHASRALGSPRSHRLRPKGCIVFYQRVTGMQAVTLPDGRRALEFGESRINLHTRDTQARPKAKNPTPGSADLCSVRATPIPWVIEHLDRMGVPIEVGPVPREGALGTMTSVYFRDLDGNLIEVASYQS